MMPFEEFSTANTSGTISTATGIHGETATPEPANTARQSTIHSTDVTLIHIHSWLEFFVSFCFSVVGNTRTATHRKIIELVVMLGMLSVLVTAVIAARNQLSESFKRSATKMKGCMVPSSQVGMGHGEHNHFTGERTQSLGTNVDKISPAILISPKFAHSCDRFR